MIAVLPSAARTASVNSEDYQNPAARRGIHVVVDMTVVGTGSITVTIQGKDPASGKYYTLLAGVAITTNVVNVYKIFPAAPVAANVSANDALPEVWRISVVHNNANPATYSIGATYLG